MKQLYKVRQYREGRYPNPWPFTRKTITVETALVYMFAPGEYLYSITLFHQGQQYALNGIAPLYGHPSMPPELLNGEPLNAFITHAQNMFWDKSARPQSRDVEPGLPFATLLEKAKAAAREEQRPKAKGFG